MATALQWGSSLTPQLASSWMHALHKVATLQITHKEVLAWPTAIAVVSKEHDDLRPNPSNPVCYLMLIAIGLHPVACCGCGQ